MPTFELNALHSGCAVCSSYSVAGTQCVGVRRVPSVAHVVVACTTVVSNTTCVLYCGVLL